MEKIKKRNKCYFYAEGRPWRNVFLRIWVFWALDREIRCWFCVSLLQLSPCGGWGWNLILRGLGPKMFQSTRMKKLI